MAFLDDQNKQNQDASQGQPGQGQPQTGGGAAPTVSSAGSSDVGTGVSTAGVGAGGQGGWTNIQAYLNANQGDNGSAKNLSDTVGGQFNQDKSQLESQSQNVLGAAQKSLSDSTISNDQADKMIKDAGQAYSWDGKQPQAYQDTASKMQAAVNGQYGGPTSYGYGLQAQTQNYGSDLSNDGAFSNLMSKLYSQKAGTPLTAGQSALQNQFDSGNQNLQQARQNLQGAYGNLQGETNQVNQDTTNRLGALANQYTVNQNNLKSYLGSQENSYDAKVNQEEQDARTAYNKEYNSGSGRQSALYRMPVDDSKASVMGLYSPNATWAGLQHEGDIKDSNTGPWSNVLNGKDNYMGQGYANLEKQRAVANADALKNWYGSEDSKYADTADTEKRNYNAISDFLGQTGNQKSQGFKVRG